MAPARIWGAIVAATVVAGTADITYALVAAGLQGTPPDRVLQYIASSVLGRAAFSGGTGAALFGLGIHYAIMACMAGAYIAASLRLAFLHQRALIAGAAYGLVLYLTMRFVLVPLTLAPQGSGGGAAQTAGMIGAHMFLVGAPIGLFARRAHRAG